MLKSFFTLCLFIGQNNPAELLYRQMEEKLLNAKTVQCVFRMKSSLNPNTHISTQGSLFLSIPDNKARLEFKETNSNVQKNILAISDGRNWAFKDLNLQKTPTIFAVPKNLCRSYLASTPFSIGGVCSCYDDRDLPSPDQLNQFHTKTKFRLGAKGTIKGKKVQSISFNSWADNVFIESTLWIDIQNRLPLKRESTGRLNIGTPAESNFTEIESYSLLFLDQDFPPTLFEIPKAWNMPTTKTR